MNNWKQTAEGKQQMDLTQSQLLFWMGQKLSPQSPMYNMALAFELSAPIELPVFRQAFQWLLRECEVMRSVFVETAVGPKQEIQNDFSYFLTYIDFADQEKPLRQWLDQRSQQPFDITACLFDSVLIRMEEERYIWYLNQHHLITDAWAVTVQYKALASRYQELLEGQSESAIQLPPYSDYIAHEQNRRNHTANEKALTFWREKVKELPEPPAFFGRQNRGMESESQRLPLQLSQAQSDQLRALTQEADLRAWTQHLSLFNIFSTVLLTFLYRISGQQKLAIGTPAHNRSSNAFKQTPGLFIELFPIMVEIDAQDRFIDVFKKVQEANFDFLRYAQTGVSRPELSRGFNVVLNYINATFSDFNGHPMRSEWVHANHADPGHSMRLQVYDFDATGAILLGFDLNVAVFKEGQRSKVPAQFMQLLNAFISDRHQLIGAPALAQEVAQFSTLVPDNFKYKAQATVLDLLEQPYKTTSDLVAIRYKEGQLSYGELEQHVNQLAHYLQTNGLKAGERAAIFLNRSPELVIAILAILKTGAAFVPIPVNYPSGRVLGIVEDAQAKLLLSNSVLLPYLPVTLPQAIALDKEAVFIEQQSTQFDAQAVGADDLAYLMYTSGSTGRPKGVMIGHRALSHYIQWAASQYAADYRPVMPLFTAVGFDLTITSLFLPLTVGGTLVTFPEAAEGPDLALFDVLEDPEINLLKLTPSHLAMLEGKDYKDTAVRAMIVGGENFKGHIAHWVNTHFPAGIAIYNEYGPTEATVGCVVHRYDAEADREKVAVPIGWPIANSQMYILDDFGHPVPEGVTGEMYIAGIGLAEAYWGQEALTAEKFVENPFEPGKYMYRSGDLVRQHPEGYLEYLGRKDLQVKIRGRRVELAEIESALNQYTEIRQAVVELRGRKKPVIPEEVHNCVSCGLPSNYPGASFEEGEVCHLCQSFTSYQEKVAKYFKTMDDLKALFDSVPADQKGEYDCLSLLSGGKDSSYAVAKLKEMGLNVLAFTLDNGYISQEAIENVKRVVAELGVDHVFGRTDAMNAIFVDSLQRHCNVCDGCFKTIYTLSIQIALEKRIPFIVTGLSRGQFFETRLTEELFRAEEVDVDKIDETILNARKAYHQVDDAVKRLLDTSMFDDDAVFEKVRFVDFYRFTDVSLEEMYEYLHSQLPWARPSDTGRSTNCIINKAGIYVHKKERGYSNYAFPYSWDVRVGHKTRDESLDEINEPIDEEEVLTILEEIGYLAAQEEAVDMEQLVAYYVADQEIPESELSQYLLADFPDYMVPVQFIRLEQMPMTVNGKIDRDALPQPDAIRPVLQVDYVAAETEFEEIVTDIWSEVLQIDKIGILDNFLAIGGDSLSGIRIMSRINEALELDLPVNLIFQQPTIQRLAAYLENTIRELLLEMDSQES
ncbi:MAG: amino acid adenylation domain-containing protein [Bacteroidota bacterium]